MRLCCFSLLTILTLSALGCTPTSSSAIGSITFEGEPVDQGNITFSPRSGPVVGGEIKNGKYSVAGLTPGPAVVNIIAVKNVPFARSSEEMARMAEEQKLKGNDNGLIDPADVIPEDAEGNNQTVSIAPGRQTLDFKLSRKASKKK